MPFPHRFIKLADEERRRISRELERLAQQGDFRRRKRLQAVYLSNSGLTYDRIAERLKVSYWSVQLWISTYQKLGLNGFPGRDEKVAEDCKNAL
ncbi:MAG: helix-turn-helix domain-containing protein [Planctomycetota bacterium]